MADVNIQQAAISTISISGEHEFFVRQKHEEAIKQAKMYGGKILRDCDFPDGGYFMEVGFANQQFKEIWENAIGLKK